MRRAIVSEGGAVAIHDVPAPTPGPKQALVRMTATGLCGSDKHARVGRHPFVSLPYVPGHEVIGVVEALGPGLDGPAVGRRVVVEPTLPCWDCKQCRSGRENICERLRFFGCGHDQGGLADRFTIDANRLHLVPDALDDRQAILIEPLATPVHAARLAGPLVGRAVAILGGGPIGLLLATVAKQQGAATVVVTDRHDAKLARARRLGVDAVVDARTPDVAEQVREALHESADVVFDTVTTQPSVDQAIALAGKGGAVVVVGVPADPVQLPLPQLQDQQLRVLGSATYLPADFDEAMALLTAGVVRPDDVVTGTFVLADVSAAFDAMASGQHIKVIVTP